MDYQERITDEAIVLFNKYGIRAVTMDMIAQELGISKRTIYENFSDKDTLLMNVIRSKANRQKEAFDQIMENCSNVIEVIFTIIETAFDQMRNANPTYLMDLKKYHYKVYEKVMNRGDFRNSEMSLGILNRGVEEGIFRDSINVELVNEGIQGFIDAAHSNDVFHNSKYTRLEILDNLLFSYLKGISTNKGIELIKGYSLKIGINGNEK
jgi:AcrR family transcriptional regulator